MFIPPSRLSAQYDLKASPTLVRFQSAGTARKFSQQELEQAYAQMESERQKEREDAQRVAASLNTLLDSNKVYVVSGQNSLFQETTPWPIEQTLCIGYSFYDAGPEGWRSRLLQIPGMRVIEPRNRFEKLSFEWDIASRNELSDIGRKKFAIVFQEYDPGHW